MPSPPHPFEQDKNLLHKKNYFPKFQSCPHIPEAVPNQEGLLRHHGCIDGFIPKDGGIFMIIDSSVARVGLR